MVEEFLEIEAIVRLYLECVTQLRLHEQPFIDIAKTYARMRGISRQAWMEFGVEGRVLDAAGIAWAGAPRLWAVPSVS